ncbi:mitochondrial small ribosomal subunit Rsm22-domain-containing protein [Halteromyces radiatus]|uniref:mitochondrial small ribosomal subunit Rsm22-domain-containing protein n=1 Tax=Halteromyces radiatus TaxID=101107 RepID=UPI00221E55CF|nr:mitochondrial small ribosomal subunit Rsm22-domain-containing protein [Halteromyces radiatus]KAI8093636.1 mitochondrial small ribosomal subunit Rsm22-domain-containing protein [Halteromyces radiatus]
MFLRSSWKYSPIIKRTFYSTTQCQQHIPEKVLFLDEKALAALETDLTSNTDLNIQLQELPQSTQEYTRGSIEADFGRKRIGCVDLPLPLIQAITKLINQQPDKRLVRTDALRLYEALRSTSRLPSTEDSSRHSSRSTKKQDPSTVQQQQQTDPHILSYGPRESAAYAAGVLPSTFAAITNVLIELKNRLSNYSPTSMLDFGTGPGTAIWAARNVFDDLDKITGVDLSEDMLRTAEFIEDASQTKKNVEFKRYLAYDPRQPKTDLVVSAFTLGDISSLALQKSTVQQLWDQTADVLVLIERGTPVGFSNIARARQVILDYEKEKVHVVAPCPHDKPCPLLYSPQANPDKFWCHFSQRVQRPSFLMKTKHSKFNTEDSKYSYVILRKGSRPINNSMEGQAYHWPRLIQPPLKKNKHVVMDQCASTGTIQRMVIPKSQGKVPYRDARKSAWGDAFPHGSKNKIVTRISEGILDQ